jgi:hypothetical protein
MKKVRKHTMKMTSQKCTTTPAPVTIDAPLSPQWAFVVQFRAIPQGPAYAAGRVEHLVSGRTAHFQSLEELTSYLDRELHATGSS